MNCIIYLYKLTFGCYFCLVYLFINTYFFMNKQRNKSCLVILENLHFGLASAAVICVLISRQHYTVDVVFSYYITTRLFWTYHSLCLEKQMFQELRQHYENGDLSSLNYVSAEEGTAPEDQESSQLMARDDPNLLSQVWWWPLFIYLEIIKRPPDPLIKDAPPKEQTSRIQFCFLWCNCSNVQSDNRSEPKIVTF